MAQSKRKSKKSVKKTAARDLFATQVDTYYTVHGREIRRNVRAAGRPVHSAQKSNGARASVAPRSVELLIKPSARRVGFDVVASEEYGRGRFAVVLLEEGVSLSAAENAARVAGTGYRVRGVSRVAVERTGIPASYPMLDIYSEADGEWLGATDEYPSAEAAVLGERSKLGLRVRAEPFRPIYARKSNADRRQHEDDSVVPPLTLWRRSAVPSQYDFAEPRAVEGGVQYEWESPRDIVPNLRQGIIRAVITRYARSGEAVAVVYDQSMYPIAAKETKSASDAHAWVTRWFRRPFVVKRNTGRHRRTRRRGHA